MVGFFFFCNISPLISACSTLQECACSLHFIFCYSLSFENIYFNSIMLILKQYYVDLEKMIYFFFLSCNHFILKMITLFPIHNTLSNGFLFSCLSNRYTFWRKSELNKKYYKAMAGPEEYAQNVYCKLLTM